MQWKSGISVSFASIDAETKIKKKIKHNTTSTSNESTKGWKPHPSPYPVDGASLLPDGEINMETLLLSGRTAPPPDVHRGYESR